MRSLSIFSAAIACSILLLVAGCGSGGSGGGDDAKSTTITGTLSGGGFVQNNWFDRFYSRFVDTAYAAGDTPDKIVAVASDGEILGDYEISANGDFTINLDDLDSDKFILFVKSTVTNEVTGHIKLGNNDDDQTLDVLDGESFEGNLQLGILDVDELICPSIEATGAFSAEDVEFFKQLSNNDDVVASLQNVLTNRDIDSYISVVCDLGSVESITDRYFDISTFSQDNFKGMRPLFYYYGAEAAALDNVTLFPPADILHSGSNNANDMECDVPADINTGINNTVSYNAVMNIVTIEMAYVDSLPEGDWILKNPDTGTTLGSFVFSPAKPFKANNLFKTFVPTPMINTFEDNITSISLKFNRYDDTGIKPTNKHFFDMLSRDLTVSYTLNGSDESTDMDDFLIDEEGFELNFVPPEPVNVDDIDRLVISYEIGGVKYQFFVYQVD